MFNLMISRLQLKLDYVRSKTRSQGQVILKAYEHSRGYMFGWIFMKLGQDVYQNNRLTEIKLGCAGSRIRSLGQIIINGI